MKKLMKSLHIICYLYLLLFGFKTIVFADNLECTAWGNALQDLQNIFNFCKILIPLLVIGLSSYDFIKSITAKDDKDIKKSFQRLMKRLVLAVVFFFLPVLLNFLLEVIGTNSSVCIEVK